ncbi:hypothetical protein ACHRVZ_15550 [Flavobacterium sp. FlaQc-57]
MRGFKNKISLKQKDNLATDQKIIKDFFLKFTAENYLKSGNKKH